MTFEPDCAVPPYKTIREALAARGLNANGFANTVGISLDKARKIMAGEIRVNRQIAKDLAYVTSVPASFWLNLEMNYQATILRIQKERNDET